MEDVHERHPLPAPVARLDPERGEVDEDVRAGDERAERVRVTEVSVHGLDALRRRGAAGQHEAADAVPCRARGGGEVSPEEARGTGEREEHARGVYVRRPGASRARNPRSAAVLPLAEGSC